MVLIAVSCSKKISRVTRTATQKFDMHCVKSVHQHRGLPRAFAILQSVAVRGTYRWVPFAKALRANFESVGQIAGPPKTPQCPNDKTLSCPKPPRTSVVHRLHPCSNAVLCHAPISDTSNCEWKPIRVLNTDPKHEIPRKYRPECA